MSGKFSRHLQWDYNSKLSGRFNSRLKNQSIFWEYSLGFCPVAYLHIFTTHATDYLPNEDDVPGYTMYILSDQVTCTK